ncbi:hypothetical protein [Nocardia asteroides]|uniref:hypothetical protein n=1 Tax=Nocardia asteroides TaxID=1824 RepID=UPI0034108C61
MTELPDLLTGTERFMTAACQPIPDRPSPPPATIVAARLLMLTEEVAELCKAYQIDLGDLHDAHHEATDPDGSGIVFEAKQLADHIDYMRGEDPLDAAERAPAEMVEAVDAFLDIAVVAYGGALEVAGIAAARRAADEVTRSNLAKIVDGVVVKRADGKVRKPIGWTAPDIAGALGIRQHVTPSFCPNCGGQNGHHGLVHNRYSTGGGGTNRPCPNTPNLTQKEN